MASVGYMGRLEVTVPFGRPGHTLEGNIRMDIKERGCECEDWLDVARDRDKWRAVINAVMDTRIP